MGSGNDLAGLSGGFGAFSGAPIKRIIDSLQAISFRLASTPPEPSTSVWPFPCRATTVEFENVTMIDSVIENSQMNGGGLGFWVGNLNAVNLTIRNCSVRATARAAVLLLRLQRRPLSTSLPTLPHP